MSDPPRKPPGTLEGALMHKLGAHVHIFVEGQVVNGVVTDAFMGGTMITVTDETHAERYTRHATDVHAGWIMLGHDARSSGLGNAS